MKTKLIIILLFICTICKSQTVTNLDEDDVTLIAHQDSTLIILNKDNTNLKEGKHKLTRRKSTITFFINEKGQIDGDLIALRNDGNLGRKTNLKNGIILQEINYTNDGIKKDSIVYGLQQIKLYDSSSKTFLPKECRIKHEFAFNSNNLRFDYESISYKDHLIVNTTFYDNGKKRFEQYFGYYENTYYENGLTESKTTYNWIKKEKTTLSYNNKGKLESKITNNSLNYILKNGFFTSEIITDMNNDGKNGFASTTTNYYPNQKVKSIETDKNDIITTKEFSITGKLLKTKSSKKQPDVMPAGL